MKLNSVHTKPSLCPTCGMTASGATHAANRKIVPKPGDLGVCVNCGAPNIYTDDMQLRPIRLEEFLALRPALQVYLHKMRAACQQRGPLPIEETQH